MNGLINVTELSDLIMKSEDFAELSDKLDVYCPFEALSVARMEIKHSSFLADIVDPRRPHGFEDHFTQAFLETLLSAADELALLLQLHLEDLGEIEVMREWRNIDLLLRLPGKIPSQDLVFVVEIKVEASESKGQLKTYQTTVEKTWPEARCFFFFLTAQDEEASDPRWINVGFSSLVEKLEAANRDSIGEPKARMMLESYTQMLRRRYLEDPTLENLAQKIWENHPEALGYLAERQPNPVHELAKQMAGVATLTQLNDALKTATGHELSVTGNSQNARYFSLAVKQWDQIQGMMTALKWTTTDRILLCEIEVTKSGVGARMVIGRGDSSVRRMFFEALKDGDAVPLKVKALSGEFTRVASTALRTRSQMEKIIKNGIEEKEVEKLRSDIVSFFAEILPKFDKALERLPREAQQ
ncbi:PD-(D/E)XK nuclease family protein [Candidatus Halocynthiibacter alkanivorans]|uniref:PDDEXK-like family protein n=1 Tax=Candidatus Halocynthiibacter alkanivorans TaxID=2267619 RepID=UPI000DF15684|nr:PD-(D/E)XK nuclease family protein [Candidatus Halocynthiibacter alkanivorans]